MNPTLSPQRGEIWLVNFDPQAGDEIKKIRPAVVINLPLEQIFKLRIVIPFTEWQPSFQGRITKVQVGPDANNGLSKLSAIDLYQSRSVSLNRFVKRLGRLDATILDISVRSLAALIKAT